MPTVESGQQLFARYAFAPNELGYCGPAQARTLFELGATGRTEADVAAVAKRFAGAWPYLTILAELAGIDDPLDERVVRGYWIGGSLLGEVDRLRFGERLLALIGAQAGHYWTHLTPALLGEATATHGFHVLGVYPWSRLLRSGSPGQPLRVLDSCRIRWGRVIALDGEHVLVRSRRLTWDGQRLDLSPARPERVRIAVDGVSFVPDARPGDWLALHWDWVCERLTAADVARLRQQSRWQLDATNARLGLDITAS
ncbi:MAG TPA: DUF6390 family protein [Jatrophihabitantaceae bacterium]|nr:DUF6390 family protein [Jatrophihabitantaceae bacterium]